MRTIRTTQYASLHGNDGGGMTPAHPSVAAIAAIWAALVIAPPSSPAESSSPTEPSSRMASLLRAFPADAAIVLTSAAPTAAESPDAAGSSLALAALLIDQAQRIGLLSRVDESVRCWLDSAVALSLAQEYAHGMALLDVRAAARADGGHELAGLHAALVIRAGPDIERIQRQIQHLLSTYTNTEESSLVTVGDGDHRRFTLRDRRLPDWCVIEWGRIGALYVVTVGEGAFERIVRTIGGTEPALTDDAWFERAVARTHVQEASHMLLMRFDLLRAAGDAAYTQKALNVQRALELDGVDRGVWTARRKGRSGEVLAFLRRNGEESLTPIAGESFLRDLPPDIIPDGATRFVVFRCEPAAAIRTLAEAYLLSRDPAQRTESRTFWRSLQKEAGVSFETDLFSQLGSRIVMHDYPPHALGLSLARTFLFPINGDAAALRDRIDRLLEHVAKSEGWPPIPQLRRNDRGVWYLFAGLAGPALTVTDDWLVVSFSPEAVRAVVDGLRPAAQSVASEP